MIYFIQAADGQGPVKIGHTNRDVRQRAAEFERTSPKLLKVLAFIEGSVVTEQKIHDRFAYLKHHAEWFYPDPELMAFIAQLPSQGGAEKVTTRQCEGMARNGQRCKTRIAGHSRFCKRHNAVAEALGVKVSDLYEEEK